MHKYSNNVISHVAHFAEQVGIGSAKIVGESIAEYLSRDLSKGFELDVDPATTLFKGIDKDEQRKYMYSFCESVLDGIPPSHKLRPLMIPIMSNAVYPAMHNDIFDEEIGQAVVDLGGFFFGFIVRAEDNHFVLLSYIDDISQWSITKAEKRVCRRSSFFPHLSINQMIGALNLRPIGHGYALNLQQLVSGLYSVLDKSFRKTLESVKPKWAKGVLIAENRVNKSDMSTDYHGHQVADRVIIGFSKHTRNLFPEFRKVAATFDKTLFLANSGRDAEHRESYSCGAGVYLSEGHANSGWQIRKASLDDSYIAPATFAPSYNLNQEITNSEILILNEKAVVTKKGSTVSVNSDDVDLLDSLEKKGFVRSMDVRYVTAPHTDISLKVIREALYPNNVRKLF